MVDFDKWKTTTPRDVEVVVGYCEQCGGEIYLGESLYRTKIGRFHGEDSGCLYEYAKEDLQAEEVDGIEGLLD